MMSRSACHFNGIFVRNFFSRNGTGISLLWKRNAKSLWIQTKMANDVLLGLLEVLGA